MNSEIDSSRINNVLHDLEQWHSMSLREQARSLSHLIDQDMGIYGAGYGISESQETGLFILVEEGLPDEFKEILRSAIPDGKIEFKEIGEPKLL